MKKLISAISGLAIGAFGFLGFLMAAFVFNPIIGKATTTSGYDFLSFEVVDSAIEVAKNLGTLQLIFSIVAVIFFVIAGLLAVVSLARLFVNKNKSGLPKVQTILAVVSSVLAIILFVLAISYVITYNNTGASEIIELGIGVGMILVPIVTIAGTALISVFNNSKKK